MKKHQMLTCVCIVGLLVSSSTYALTKHAIILVMDGARYTETLGDSTHVNVPNIAALAAQGCLLTAFKTAATGSVAESWTETCPGHSRLTTGTYQNIANDGTELPTQPGIFQYFRKQNTAPANSGWVICSKDKLFILANSSASGWNNQYQPSMNCGVSGTGSGGYRADSVTQKIVLQKLIADRPALMIINYKGPDAMGHANNWNGYIDAIREVDRYAKAVWDTIQSDQELRSTTALFIVNDHGRHANDFTSHGDNCGGCRNIMCVALGPDIRTHHVSSTTREQIDIAPTIAEMMGFTVPASTGHIMTEILLSSATGKNRHSSVIADSKEISVSSRSRQVIFRNLPRNASVEILSCAGVRMARLSVINKEGTAVWNATTPNGTAARGSYVGRVTGDSFTQSLVLVNAR